MPSKPKRRPEALVAPKPGIQPRKPPFDAIPFLERHSLILAVALIVLGTIRIAATYTVFSHTADEPAHIASGMEWLDKGVYTWEPQHPPLARIATALGPYLLGVGSQGTPHTNIYYMTAEGLAILFKPLQKLRCYPRRGSPRHSSLLLGGVPGSLLVGQTLRQ